MKDIICYKLLGVDNVGVILSYKSKNIKVIFEECAKNYAKENFVESSKCVADRDIQNHLFIFYTTPKTKVVFGKVGLERIFRRMAHKRFLNLQKAISQYGYTSFDLS